jgi:cardiolipin-specific phospholipase
MEAQALHDYIYHISAQPGSGEYALGSLLLPGAWARRPLANRVHDLKVPTSFIYGKDDWMDYRGALSVLDRFKVPTRIALVENAGHHLYLDNPEGFNASLLAEILGGQQKAKREDGVLYVHG